MLEGHQADAFDVKVLLAAVANRSQGTDSSNVIKLDPPKWLKEQRPLTKELVAAECDLARDAMKKFLNKRGT